MNHDEWLERAEIYAIGSLDGEELTQFEAHLASGCRLCENHLRETRETLTAIPRSLEQLTPPSFIKARLFDQTVGRATLPSRERVQFRWLWWSIGAGALVAATLLVALSWNLFATQQELQKLQSQLANLQIELAKHEEVIQFLSDPQVRLIQLSGLEPSPLAAGRLLWNPTSQRGLLLASGLPQTPSDKAYELWAITGNRPVPAGVFTVDQKGRAIFRLPPLVQGKTFDKFAVTLEPADGVPKATGPMYLLGGL